LLSIKGEGKLFILKYYIIISMENKTYLKTLKVRVKDEYIKVNDIWGE